MRDNCSPSLGVMINSSTIDMEEASSVNSNITDTAAENTTVHPKSNTTSIITDSVSIDGCKTSKVKNVDCLQEEKVIIENGSITNEEENQSIRQVGKKCKESADKDVLTDCLMSLFLSQSKLTTGADGGKVVIGHRPLE